MARDQRRLAAIVSADVAGYSLLMGRDESATLAGLKAHRRELIDSTIAEYGGRIVKTTGDGLLVEFASVVEAVRCAVDVQRGMAERNAAVPTEQRIEFRIGINLGDIIIDGDDIAGDGINVAARLEALAEPGGICVSGSVREQVHGNVDVGFLDIGEQQLKNIARPVRVHRILLAEGSRRSEGAGGTSANPPPTAPSAASRSVSQTMIDSPGSIQAGGDVVVAADRRLIQSIRLYVSIETDTPATAVSGPQTDVGLGSVIALFTRDETRIRFASDFKVVDHQRTSNRRRLSFVYEPETPMEVLGKPVAFLGMIDALTVNYAEIFRTEGFDTQNGQTELECAVVVNGIPIAKIRAAVQPPGTLGQGQASLQVADVFGRIPNAYTAAVSR